MINYFGKSSKVKLNDIYNIIDNKKDGFYHSGVDTTLKAGLIHTDNTHYYIASELKSNDQEIPTFDFTYRVRELSYVKKFDLPKIDAYYPDIKGMLPSSYEVWRDLKKMVLLNRELFKSYINLKKFNKIDDDTVLKYLRMYADAVYHPTISNSYLVNILDRLDISNDTYFKSKSDMQIKQYEDVNAFKEVFNRYIYYYIVLKYYNEPHLINSMQPDLARNIDDPNLDYSYKFKVNIKRTNINKTFYTPFISGFNRSTDISQTDYNRYYKDVKFTKNIRDIMIELDKYVSSNPYTSGYILENPKGSDSFVNKFKNAVQFRGKSTFNLTSEFNGWTDQRYIREYDVYGEKHGGGILDLSYYYDCYERGGDDDNLEYCKFISPMVSGYVNGIFSMYEIKDVSMIDDVITVRSTPLRKSTTEPTIFSDYRMQLWDKVRDSETIPVGVGHNGVFYKNSPIRSNIPSNTFKYKLSEPALFTVLDYSENISNINISRVDTGLLFLSDKSVYSDESVPVKNTMTSQNTYRSRSNTPTPDDINNKMTYYMNYPQSYMPSYLYQPTVPQNIYDEIDIYDRTRKYNMSRVKKELYKEDVKIFNYLYQNNIIGYYRSSMTTPWFPTVVTSRKNTGIPMSEYHPTVVMRLYWGYGQRDDYDTWGYKTYAVNERDFNANGSYDHHLGGPRESIPSRLRGHYFEQDYDVDRFIDAVNMMDDYYYAPKEKGISNFNIIAPDEMLKKHKYTSSKFGTINPFTDRDFDNKWLFLFNGATTNTDIKDYGIIYHNLDTSNHGVHSYQDGFGYIQYMNVFCLNIPETTNNLSTDIKTLSREYQSYRMDNWLPKEHKDKYRQALENIIRKNTTTKNTDYITISNTNDDKYELSDIDLSDNDIIGNMVSSGTIIEKGNRKILIYKIAKNSVNPNDKPILDTIKNNRLNVTNINLNNNIESWVDRFDELSQSLNNNIVYTNSFPEKSIHVKIFKNNTGNNIILFSSDNNLYVKYGDKTVRLHNNNDKPSIKKGLMTDDSINTLILNLSKTTALDILRDYGLVDNGESIIDTKTISRELFNTKLTSESNINTNNDVNTNVLHTNDISTVTITDNTDVIKEVGDELIIGNGDIPIYINAKHLKSVKTNNGIIKEGINDYINDKFEPWNTTIPTLNLKRENVYDITNDLDVSPENRDKLNKNVEIKEIYNTYLKNKPIDKIGFRLLNDRGISVNRIIWLGDSEYGYNHISKLSENARIPREDYSYIYNDRLYRRMMNNENISEYDIPPLFVRSQAYTLDELGIRSRYRELKVELLINGNIVDTIYLTKDQIEGDSRYSYYYNKNINYGNDKFMVFGIDLVKTSINRNGFLNTVVYYSFIKNKNKNNLIYDIKLYWR